MQSKLKLFTGMNIWLSIAMRTVTVRELLKPSTVSAAVVKVDSWFHCTRNSIRIKRVSVYIYALFCINVQYSNLDLHI